MQTQFLGTALLGSAPGDQTDHLDHRGIPVAVLRRRRIETVRCPLDRLITRGVEALMHSDAPESSVDCRAGRSAAAAPASGRTTPGSTRMARLRRTQAECKRRPWSRRMVPTNIVLAPLGLLTVKFTNGNCANVACTVNGVSRSKQMMRQVSRIPGTVCQQPVRHP